MKALIISADNFEDSELLVPYYRLKEEGAEVDIASFDHGKITGEHRYAVEVNIVLKEVNADNYDLLLLPGGKAPELIRKEKKALDIVKRFFEADKIVSAICHGPQILLAAGVMKGRHATCYRTVASAMKSAGALYEDREVVVDGNIVTSRQPSDLPAFMRETLKLIRKTKKSK
ncbi:MAG: type 1 glutamine amidotransferase domain-containing protein [Nitrospirota bacterium]